MKDVAKYNVFKGVSMLLTMGTPIITLACCGDFFVHRSETAVSAAGVFVIILLVFLFKDKIVEKFKMPSAFVLSTAIFVLLLLVENIMMPIKCVCIATMIATGVDELTFKRFYKNIECTLPKAAVRYKHLGFLFTTSYRLAREKYDEDRG